VSDVTDIQQRRIAVLRKARRDEYLEQKQLAHITTDPHAQMGIIAEFVLAGLLEKAHVDKVQRWRWTPAAMMALDIFEPRKGRHE
jgi:hypothetical protein